MDSYYCKIRNIKITINPQNNTYEKAFDAVYFTESETDGKIDVHFNNKKVGEVLKASSEKWYTIHYRIYNGNASAKHSIKIIDDENNSAVIDVNWQDTYTEEGTFSPVNRYGIMFYANATINTQTYMNLDDIRFANEGYHEDFESYNLKKYYHSTGARLSNGAKGNMNLDLYKENGVFEGNMAYNNFIYKIRTVNEMTNPPRVYGNIPSWQGYVSEVALGVNAYVTDKWKDTCTIVTAEDRYEVKGAGFRQALMLYPKATENLKASQSVYVGMENTDFSGITTIESSFNVYNANTDNDIFKLQLTNGRSNKKTYSNNAAYSSLAYDGNSFDAIYEPLKIENGIIWFCGVNIGTYNVKTTYDSEYTIDTAKFTHSIKITNKADGKVVAEASGAMNGIDEFSFEGIAGFRYVASTPEYVDAKTENRVIIDDVHVTNQLDETVTGVPETMNLTVDTKQIIKKVSESTYGINFEWGGDPERYIAKDKNGNFTTEINQKFVEVFDDNIKLARMAGVSANWMLWKEAIGDVEDRGEMYFWHYDKRVQRYGLVEWLKSVKMADEDAKLIYTVNMPRNKPTDQRILELIGNKINQIETLENVKDLVRFMTLKPDDPKAIGSDGINWAQKRVELGITEPVEVYAWELGCELDADGQGWYRIAEYIEMCKPVIKAIREIDPDAKISVHEKTSIYYSETITRSWHNQLLNALGNDIDYLSVHNYYAPESWGDFEQYLDTLLLDIAQTPAKDKIKILLTEHSSGRNSDKTNAGDDYN